MHSRANTQTHTDTQTHTHTHTHTHTPACKPKQFQETRHTPGLETYHIAIYVAGSCIKIKILPKSELHITEASLKWLHFLVIPTPR